ncbi:MAG TPA: succinylglutamate desuccinylase/aspartoacylase family protein, partial [Alkalispirochaeta sp.]|nr:succinylglutamate desuccinylase/aspartoacylase family protein [Alkalispirochaeta sp.]
MKRSDHIRLNDTVVRQAALIGGTHGNERTGVTAIARRHLSSLVEQAGLPVPYHPTSFHLHTMLGNPRAVAHNRRYIDFDLNRCFAADDLAAPHEPGYERQRAQVLNAMLGPKTSADPACQFLIDLHTTTAALGPTVIIREDELLARVVAALVQQELPEVRIMSYGGHQPERPQESAGSSGSPTAQPGSAPPVAGGGPGSVRPGGDHPYVAEITPHGIEIEVGPVPQGVIRADVLILTERIINSVLLSLDRWNRDEELDIPAEITVYRYVGDSDFPRAPDGSMAGMIHPQRQDRDFEP